MEVYRSAKRKSKMQKSRGTFKIRRLFMSTSLLPLCKKAHTCQMLEESGLHQLNTMFGTLGCLLWKGRTL